MVSGLNVFARWIIFPGLYAVCVMPVLVATILVLSSVERAFGCPACDLGGFLGMLLAGAFTFLASSFHLITTPTTTSAIAHSSTRGC